MLSLREKYMDEKFIASAKLEGEFYGVFSCSKFGNRVPDKDD